MSQDPGAKQTRYRMLTTMFNGDGLNAKELAEYKALAAEFKLSPGRALPKGQTDWGRTKQGPPYNFFSVDINGMASNAAHCSRRPPPSVNTSKLVSGRTCSSESFPYSPSWR